MRARFCASTIPLTEATFGYALFRSCTPKVIAPAPGDRTNPTTANNPASAVLIPQFPSHRLLAYVLFDTMTAGRPRSGRLWPVQVHDEWAVADEGDDELLGLVQWVHVTVNEAGGHVEEAASLHFGALLAPAAKLEAEATPDDVPE